MCDPYIFLINILGRSMGARIAAEIATSYSVTDGFVFGVGCISYPLHKPKKFSELRTSHLIDLSVPVFIINGTCDKMCNRERMDKLVGQMLCDVTMHWVSEADHSLYLKNKLSDEVVENMCKWFVEWCQTVFSVERS